MTGQRDRLLRSDDGRKARLSPLDFFGGHDPGDEGWHYFRPGIDQDDPEHPDPRWCNVCGQAVAL